jgi:hypothetical protein
MPHHDQSAVKLTMLETPFLLSTIYYAICDLIRPIGAAQMMASGGD